MTDTGATASDQGLLHSLGVHLSGDGVALMSMTPDSLIAVRSEMAVIIRSPMFSVSLRAFHPRIKLDWLSEELGIPAEILFEVGAPRKTPKGRPLDGKYDLSYWCAELEGTFGEEFGEFLERQLKFLESHRQALDVVTKEGRVELYTWLYVGWYAGETLSPALLRGLGSLGVEIGLEVTNHPPEGLEKPPPEWGD